MKTLLLTGFEPFLDHPVNPSERIVTHFNGETIGRYKIVGRVLPVDYAISGDQLIQAYEEVQPDLIISLGLSAGRNRITPERIGINVNDSVTDNTGRRPLDEPIVPGGPDGYFSTLPIRAMVDALHQQGLPAAISNSAGTYLCNNVMYRMLHHLATIDKRIQSGFVHIPASHDMALEKSYASWSMDDLIKGIRIVMETATKE